MNKKEIPSKRLEIKDVPPQKVIADPGENIPLK